MDNIAVAIAIHVVAIVWWIGGVAMVTTVILPACRQAKDGHSGFAMFQAVEQRFAWQARAAVLLAGASGFYLVDRLALWSSFFTKAFWWLDAMVFVWGLFAIVLFVAEPLFLHARVEHMAARAPARTLMLLQRMHTILLALSIITVLGAVAGSNGLTF
jgi:uncharacterized membrane protein